MATAQEVTLPQAAALPLAAEDFNGRKLEFHPFVIDDFAAWDRWARADFLHAANAEAETVKDAAAKRQFIGQALEAAGRISFGSPRAFGPMDSVAGKLEACWLSLRHGDEKLTREAAWKLIGGEKMSRQSYQNLNRAFLAVMKASGLASEAEEGGPLAQVVDTMDAT
jgi:hypothetical protein